MDWIEVNGTSLRYELSGSGDKVLVLVHEMGGTLDSWDQVMPLLSPGRRVLRHDWRGAGMSEKLHAPPSLSCRQWRCWTAMGSMALRVFTSLPGMQGRKPTLGRKFACLDWVHGSDHRHGCLTNTRMNPFDCHCFAPRVLVTRIFAA